MTFENMDVDTDMEGEETSPPEESSNRMFLIAAGVLGAIALLALICIAIYALVLLPRQNAARDMQKATVDAQNTEIAVKIALTSTSAAKAAIEAAYTHTPTVTSIPPSPSPTSSPTSVVVQPSEAAAVSPTLEPAMATATALRVTLTANAVILGSTLTARPLTTSIPSTGFADEVGLPMMLGLAILLIAVIFLARRLRSA
jgi:LPXTG-motif cell wall-anchored protein